MCNFQSIELIRRRNLAGLSCKNTVQHTGKNWLRCRICLVLKYCFCDGLTTYEEVDAKSSEINYALHCRFKSRRESRQMYPGTEPATAAPPRFRQAHIHRRSVWINIDHEATGYDANVNGCLSRAADKASSNHYYCDGYAYRLHLIEQITECSRERLAKHDLFNSVLNEIQFHPKFMRCALDRIDMDTYFEQLGY